MDDMPVSFEEKLEKLKKILEDLERGDIPLKESLDKFEAGIEIIKKCYEELENTEMRIEKVMKKDGKLIFKEFESEEK